MIVEKSLIDKLKNFGLNSYEAKLWAALLSRGTASAGELADISNVPRSRSYDVLESLKKKGFISMKSSKPIVYEAISPNEVIDSIKKSIKIDVERNTTLLESLKEDHILAELQDLHEKGISSVDESELSGNIKGRENIYHHIGMMIKNSSKNLVLMANNDEIKIKKEMFDPLLKTAKERGVKIAFHVPKNIDSSTVKDLEKIGTVVKRSNVCRLCVSDDKEALFMLHGENQIHKSYDTAIWISNPYFAKNISYLIS